jgi:hypothetical protein
VAFLWQNTADLSGVAGIATYNCRAVLTCGRNVTFTRWKSYGRILLCRRRTPGRFRVLLIPCPSLAQFLPDSDDMKFGTMPERNSWRPAEVPLVRAKEAMSQTSASFRRAGINIAPDLSDLLAV